MRTIRNGMLLLLATLIVYNLPAQTYKPKVDYKEQTATVYSFPAIQEGGTSLTVNSNEIDLQLHYEHYSGASFPKNYTVNDYKPLKAFWEFYYPNTSGKNNREYSFSKSPSTKPSKTVRDIT